MSESNGSPAPPSHLSAKSRDLWRSILDRYELEDEELATLTLALESFDTAQTARRLLRREGLVVRDRFDQPKPHPAAAVCRDAMSTWSRLMRDLGLPIDEEEPKRQPRSLHGEWARRQRGRGRVALAKAAEHG